MRDPQPTQEIAAAELREHAARLLADGWRLMQICCTNTPDEFEMLYSFAKALEFQNLRLRTQRTDPSLPSITPHYLCAFIYENEIHDLFGISFEGLLIDFHGTFFKGRTKTPFATPTPTPTPGATPPPIPASSCTAAPPPPETSCTPTPAAES